LAVPNREDLLLDLSAARQRLEQVVTLRLDDQRWQLKNLAQAIRQLSPQARIQSDRQRLDELSHRAATTVRNALQIQRSRLEAAVQRLDDLNPQTVLARGYALVTDAEERIVRSVAQVAPGDALHVRISDGEFGVEVKDDRHI
jgi:exodeoxyribonuclease VII large subunit